MKSVVESHVTVYLCKRARETREISVIGGPALTIDGVIGILLLPSLQHHLAHHESHIGN
ncbi:hypothetical protein SODALDRAFT_354339 [Sodiomyces alkalinus F11]|uniref:Uncharacterized protein n=1 Tax=Sodiomyces alkalinus (strain CBS 110278 / VKM F-3762 / F11) TaxID=1314773 RepID=A0A3N2Q602_SODAK|nr:hypothetical protein SODALDRAFT_354339 [Sodiomyces alkalinus F11]ROT42213.1 hypothetical protein SODALDRAFT_354339 [Sodiomyces alkalinus F11]